MTAPVVLIVYDDPLLVSLVRHKLNDRGYSVFTARTVPPASSTRP